MTNSYTDQERLDTLARRISESGIDLTASQRDWTIIAYACASQGEGGREAFHLISSNYPGYSREECDKHFSYCLKTTKNQVSMGTLIEMCRRYGIDTAMPRGRRPKTEKQRKEEQENRFKAMCDYVRQHYKTRYNVWKNRVEVCQTDGQWQFITDREFSTIYTQLKQAGVGGTINDLKALLESRDFSPDYDAVNDYLDALPTYDPGCGHDYINEFFAEHLIYTDPAEADYVNDMLRKWFVGMVALWRGLTDENPIMPVFYGTQHIGKTYFVRHILPPSLRSYYKEPNPGDKVDKDYIISLSEVNMMFLDEFRINTDAKNDAYKAIITSIQSNLRDSYGHFREVRQRKASLIGATNQKQFLRDAEGNRRFVGIDLKATVNLNDHPLPYEGAYAQALWLIKSSFDPKPTAQESCIISQHNQQFMVLSECEAALSVFLRHPQPTDNPEAYTSGELMKLLADQGFRGREYNPIAIGKAMKQMGFEKKSSKGQNRYLVVIADPNRQKQERCEMAVPEEEMPF